MRMHLLTRIVNRQRWGIPPVAPAGWRLYFKGGWSGRAELAGQPGDAAAPAAAPLLDRVLTREQPSKGYGERSIEGVARRLLARLQPADSR